MKSNFPKIGLEILEARWLQLKQHAERSAVFIISVELDLIETANKMASDDAVTIGKYVSQGKIARPSPELMKTWDEMPTQVFRFVIVQPYVIIQHPGH